MTKASRACTLLLRFLAMAATIAAAVTVATTRETTTFFNIPIKAEFYYNPSFTYFLVANAIAGIYSLLALFVPPAVLASRWFVLLDVVIGMLLAAAVAAVATIGHVAKKGNEHAGWLPVCDHIHKFCNHAMGALISGVIGLLLYTVILFHTTISTELNPLRP